MSQIEYPPYDLPEFQRALDQIEAAKESQQLEALNNEFRGYCQRLYQDRSHLKPRPGQDPTMPLPEETVDIPWVGNTESADDLGAWFTMYAHYSDDLVNSEWSDTHDQMLTELEGHPEREAGMVWFLGVEDMDRIQKICRLVAWNYSPRLYPTVVDEVYA